MPGGKAPRWLRALEVIVGILLIALALYLIAFPAAALAAAVILIATALIAFGIIRLLGGFLIRGLTLWSRVLSIVAGLLALILGWGAIAYPALGLLTIVIYVAIVLLIAGFDRIVTGLSGAGYPGWVRLTQVIVGFLALLLSAAIIVIPLFGLEILVLLLSIEFFIFGIEAVATGLRGYWQ
jgi:uncharacterized membrane protein HdeD (DUF308 family)